MFRFAALAAIALLAPLIAMAQSATMYKTPWCGCCSGHAAYLDEHGFDVEIIEQSAEELAGIKDKHAVPAAQQGCHTLVIEGYVVEGHVPAEAIEALLAKRPDITGISLPGMPTGSPGMSGDKTGPFTVEVIGTDGKVFMEL